MNSCTVTYRLSVDQAVEAGRHGRIFATWSDLSGSKQPRNLIATYEASSP